MNSLYCSYSRKDSAFVYKIVHDLKDHGLDVWIDNEKLTIGERWMSEMEKAIVHADFVLVFLSSNSIRSEWIYDEIAFSRQKQKSIIPILLDNVDLPLSLANTFYVDFRDNHSYDDNFKSLLKALSASPLEKQDKLLLYSPKHFQLFLCYSFLDRQIVRDLYERLTKEGYDVWFDIEELRAGENWQLKIQNAIDRADSVIICLSKNAIVNKGYFQKELQHVNERWLEQPEDSFYLIPVRLEECVVPQRLSTVHYIDLFQETGWEQLLKSIERRKNQILPIHEDLMELTSKEDSVLPTGNKSEKLSPQDSETKADLSKPNLNLLRLFSNTKAVTNLTKNVSEILSEIISPGGGNVEKIASSQIKLLTSYYSLVLDQAERSFSWALIWATVGMLGFIIAGVFLLVYKINDIALIGTIGSALIEVISGINFYLYNKSSTQLAEFHVRLDSTQRLLLSNAVAEKIEGELKQITRSHIALKFAGIDVKPEVVEESLDLTPKVHITYIESNPTGSDVAKEFVTLENSGKVVADMTNWSLSDEAGHTYKFPMFFLKPGASVNIWTRNGKNIPTDLYWKMKRAIWNNNEDVAYLKDSDGNLIDSYSCSANKKGQR